MLDDGHRIPLIAQPAQRLDEPLGIARVQPDRRLVEHVKHAGQSRSEERGEAQALGLARGERWRSALH